MVSQTQQANLVSNLDTSKYEAKTQEIAKQILSGSGKSSIWAKLSQLKDDLRLDDKLMAWTMENEG